MDTKSIIMNTVFIVCGIVGIIDIICAYDEDTDYSGGPSTVISLGSVVAISVYWLLSAL